jgi:hypothetical protein
MIRLCSLNNINWLVFVMGASGVHCEVRTALADNVCICYVTLCILGLLVHSEIRRNEKRKVTVGGKRT